VCAVTAALDGNASGTCTGAGTQVGPIGTPGSPGTGVTLPVTICGIEVALGGTSVASCPQPTVSTSPASTPAPSTTAATTAPAKAAPAAAPTAVHTAAASAPLALTGAPLLVELFIGAAAVILGLVISRLSRRRGAHQA
jgi:hypothetical protein